jgi:hypothetical protein
VLEELTWKTSASSPWLAAAANICSATGAIDDLLTIVKPPQ